MRALRRGELPARLAGTPPARATTLGVVATDAVADQGRGEQGRADGARRPGAQHQPGPHDERRRRRLRARHRRERPQRAARTLLGALAADVLADAVLRAVRAARPASAAPACPTCRRRATSADGADDDRPETPHERSAASPAATSCSPLRPPARALARRLRDPPPAADARRRSSSCTATATPPRSGPRRSGASSRTAGRASACTRSTCPTRSRATTTPSRRPGRTLDRRAHGATSPPRSSEVLRRDRRAARSCWSATRAAATRSATTSQRRRRGARCRTRSSAACRTTASGPIRRCLPGSEFNGAGPFLTRAQRAARAPTATRSTPGVAWMTIRSDNNDKFAQPDGALDRRSAARRRTSTFDGPALKGAENVVIAGIDHRETAFGAAGLRADVPLHHRPARRRRWRSRRRRAVVLDGKVSGLGLDNRQRQLRRPTCRWSARRSRSTRSTRRPASARGAAVHRKTIGADGRWGPFDADAGRALRVRRSRAPGYATTHIYRSPFPRSSRIVQPARRARSPTPTATRRRVVTLTRPRGYFGVPRDRIEPRRQEPAAGHPARRRRRRRAAGSRLAERGARAVVGEFNDERIVGRAWPVADNHVVVLELTSDGR